MIDTRLLASAIANPATVFSVVGGLVFWAASSAWSLQRGTSKLVARLAAATRRIGRAEDPVAFARNYEALSTDLAGDPVLGARWREYSASLVLPREGARLVRSTTSASSWFDTSLLRAPGIGVDARYHAALPNLLVGAGLLFTFIGLAAALGTAGGIVSAGDQTTRNDALRMLLDTASFKFITSLAGLLLSIIYAVYRKRRLHILEKALDTFVAALDARVPLLTPAALQQEANDLLQRQSAQLETFSTDLAVNIGATFDQAFDRRLGDHIAPLTKAMESLANGMGSRSEETMKAMLDAFLERLRGGTGDRIQEVTTSLSGLGAQLEGMQVSLREAAAHMAQSADAMARRMGEGAESALSRIVDQTRGLLESLQGMAEQTRTAGTEAGRAMVTRIEAATGQFEHAALSITSAMEALTLRITELSAAARDATMPLVTAGGDLKAAGQAVRGALEPFNEAARSATRAIDQIAGTAQRLEGAQAATISLVEGLNAAALRFEGVDRELAKTIEELQTWLQGFRQQITEFVSQTDENLAKAATQLGSLVKGLQDCLEEFNENVLSYAARKQAAE